MQIDELAGNTVKITLDPSDMDGHRIKFGRFPYLRACLVKTYILP